MSDPPHNEHEALRVLIECVWLTKTNGTPAHCYWNRSGQIYSSARPRWAEGLRCPSGQVMERGKEGWEGGGGVSSGLNHPPTPSLPRQIISLRCWNMLMLIWCWEINDGNTEQLPFFPMLPFQQRRRRGTRALQQYSKWLLLIWTDGQGNQPTCSASPALLTATWSPQELYFIMSYANASGWKGEKGKERVREGEKKYGAVNKLIIGWSRWPSRWGRGEIYLSFTASHIPFIFWQRDLCACGRVLTLALDSFSL